jgi:DNA-binding NtrC family response regulator
MVGLMQPRRILVIEESEVVRETLALILGREFIVVKRPFGHGSFTLADADRDVDLLILGVTPTIGKETTHLLQFADKAPFAVLFLVDSKSTARAIEDRERVGCLAKPFNPYELKEKVGRLLARTGVLRTELSPLLTERQEFSRYLEFPYLSRATAMLAHRFAATRLPILVSGELGCGQERVARALHSLTADFGSWFSLNAADINAAYLKEKKFQLSWTMETSPATLIVANLDRIPVSSQAEFLNFLEEEESRLGNYRLVTTARGDLLEKVYQGEFLEALYYKLATLKLTLRPLRERRDDVPAVAAWFAQFYASQFGLGEISFSRGANERLSNYLWFGNLNEMETVIARTLAAQRKTRLESSDLIFDFSVAEQVLEPPKAEEFVSLQTREQTPRDSMQDPGKARDGSHKLTAMGNGRDKPELSLLIHELAHELKNPMVTIKTFAQLLSDRYQDEDFRTRFQDVVGGDIERMDELLELMIEFAEFSQPRWSKVPLEEKLRSALEEVASERARRQAQIRWKGNGYSREIRADESQLKYVLKNVLLAVLSQAKMGSEIEIDAEKQGSIAISYFREGGRVASITQYLGTSSPQANESTLPLRILLAKQLVERNGGHMTFDYADPERETLKLEFPIA